MRKPSVSVIIPAYNAARFLPHAIESVRAQQWPNLEIIVVDDGSTDETRQVLDRCSGKDLRVITQANAGVSAARNAGIEAADGEWIAFLDADDLWLPRKLVAQMDALEKSEAMFCYSGVKVREQDAREWDFTYSETRPVTLEVLLYGNQLATPTVVIHRDCFAEIGLFDVSLRTGEDWDMWLRLMCSYRSCCVSDPYVIVQRTGGTEKYPLDQLEICTLRVLEKFFLYSRHKTEEPLPGQRQIMAYHYLVLAKSYLRGHNMGKALVFSWKSFRTGILGLRI